MWGERWVLDLAGLWVGLGFSVDMEAFGRALTNVPFIWEFSGGSKSWSPTSGIQA